MNALYEASELWPKSPEQFEYLAFLALSFEIIVIQKSPHNWWFAYASMGTKRQFFILKILLLLIKPKIVGLKKIEW